MITLCGYICMSAAMHISSFPYESLRIVFICLISPYIMSSGNSTQDIKPEW